MTRGAALKPLDGRLDQGDVIANVPLLSWKTGKPEFRENRAIVTSHGCVCEDYERCIEAGKSSAANRVIVQVTPLRSAADLRHKAEDIRAGRLLDKFWIEGDGTTLPHQVADLSREQPIPASVLASLPKIARIADWQWDALVVHMAIARFRLDPAKLFRDEILKGAGRSGT